MTDLLVLLIGVTLGATLSHARALKDVRASTETDFEAIHARLNALMEKL